MKASAEGYLLLNFFTDFLILALASRGICFVRWRRVFLSAVFGAAYSLWDAVVLLPIWADGIALIAMLAAANGFSNLRSFLRASANAFLITFVLKESAQAMLSGESGCIPYWAGIALGSAVSLIMLSANTRKRSRINIAMRVEYKEGRREFTALVDTGNLLTEPLSALPVVIADERALGKQSAKRMFAHSERTVGFGAVGGDGQMKVIRPERMEIHDGRRWVKAPDMWLGLYPGRMTGSVHALAPGAATEVFRAERRRRRLR